MSSQVRRFLVPVVAAILIVPATVSAAADSATVDPGATATSCAQGRALNARLKGVQVAYLAQFAPCVLRADRAELGLTYVQSPAASRLVMAALGRLIRLPYLRRHQLEAAFKATDAAAANVAATSCLRQGLHHSTYNARWASFQSRPGTTPLWLSKALAQSFANSRSVIRNPHATFAIAVRRGLLMESGEEDGTMLGVVDFTCR